MSCAIQGFTRFRSGVCPCAFFWWSCYPSNRRKVSLKREQNNWANNEHNNEQPTERHVFTYIYIYIYRGHEQKNWANRDHRSASYTCCQFETECAEIARSNTQWAGEAQKLKVNTKGVCSHTLVWLVLEVVLKYLIILKHMPIWL